MDKIWIYVWKQRKLESLLDNLQNNTLSRADLSYEKGKIKNIHYGDILIKFGEILNIKKEQLPNIVNEDVVKKYKTSILQNGDVIFVDTAEDETVGKCSEIAGLTDEIVLSGLHTIPCRPKLKFADGYLGYYVNSEIFHQQLLPFMQGIKVTSISKAAMKKMNIIYPKSVEEQTKIGGYFYNLDNLITFHHRKLNILNKICRYAWEQRKLGDEATEMLAGGDIDKSRVVKNGQYPIYANALTNDGIVGYYDDYYRVKAPAVTVTGRGDVGHAQARTVDFTPVVRLLAIRSEHDVYFLENAINKHGVIVESTGVPQLTVPQLGNYIISFPTTIDEEIKIGNYFHNLDHLITLHQQKCKQLQIIRKFMLQNIFL